MGILRRFAASALLLFFLFGSGTARGDDEPRSPWYGTVRAGAYVPRATDILQLGPGYDVEIGVGRSVLPFLSLELSVARASLAGPALAGGSSNGEGVELSLMPILLSVRFETQYRQLRPWVAVGGGAYYFTANSQGAPSGPFETGWSGFGPGVEGGGGVFYQVDPRTALGVETTYTHASFTIPHNLGLFRGDGLSVALAFEYRI